MAIARQIPRCPKCGELLAKEADDKKNDAIAFANFVGNRPLPEYSLSTNKWRWWNNNTRQHEVATTEQLYTLFHQHL